MSKELVNTPKSYRISKTTRVLTVRLPNDVVDIIVRRATKRKLKASEYLRRYLEYDTRRKR